LSYWLITDSGKIISKASVEHATRDNDLQTDKKAEMDEFNQKIDESLADANFTIQGEKGFDSMYLDDINDNMHSEVTCEDDRNTPSKLDYGDMLTDERPDDEDEEAVDKYLNVELIMNMGNNDERRGCVIERRQGLNGEPIGHTHANPLFDTREYEV
jgi:Icc-related predicted phosphoesterase